MSESLFVMEENHGARWMFRVKDVDWCTLERLEGSVIGTGGDAYGTFLSFGSVRFLACTDRGRECRGLGRTREWVVCLVLQVSVLTLKTIGSSTGHTVEGGKFTELLRMSLWTESNTREKRVGVHSSHTMERDIEGYSNADTRWCTDSCKAAYKRARRRRQGCSDSERQTWLRGSQTSTEIVLSVIRGWCVMRGMGAHRTRGSIDCTYCAHSGGAVEDAGVGERCVSVITLLRVDNCGEEVGGNGGQLEEGCALLMESLEVKRRE
ncbi:hypothetical protein Tco_1392517 [Tanacetum coccineum]